MFAEGGRAGKRSFKVMILSAAFQLAIVRWDDAAAATYN